MTRGSVLFVDDEKPLRDSAGEWLSVVGFTVTTSATAAEALQFLDSSDIDALVTDVRMPNMDGLTLLDTVHEKKPHLPIILLTGHGDVTLAVDAMRRGAHDFLEKPYDADHLVAVLDRAVRDRRMMSELGRLRRTSGERVDLERRLIGNAPAIAALRDRIAQLADIDVDVLVHGETGTGKEVVARALHDCGRRVDKPFVALNCAAIPEQIFESEVFGHERGAFTGAVQRRVGRIEHADGGTVFLDEIESMPLALQAKLLRVIQERVVEPVGSNRQVPVDVRFIAATKADLKAESEAGRFRSDLYFRLSTVTLTIAPLRARGEDATLLFRHFQTAAAERHGVKTPPIGAVLSATLSAARWPGNIREVKAAAERHVLGLPVMIGPAGTALADDRNAPLSERVAAYEALIIGEALEAHGDNIQATSDALQVPRRTLGEKIARLGVRRGATDFDEAG